MIIIGVILICCIFLTKQWVLGIDYMKKHHSEYKGEDFLK